MKNKRFALALTAILCAIAICAAMIPALSVFADEEEPDIIQVLGANATVNDDFHVDGYFRIDYAFDGPEATEGLGWHATVDAQPTAAAPLYITADLNGTYDVWMIALFPIDFYSGVPVMPTDFELQLSNDNGATWETVITETGVSCSIDGDPLAYELDEPVEATDFRMVIQAPGSYIDGAYYTAIGEIEIWGELLAVETEAPAPAETEAPAPAETQAPAETEAPAPAETVVESDVESADESAEETDTETTDEIVDETVGETGVEETVAETKAETKAPAAVTADEGCASVVGFGAVAVLTAAAAAVVLKKKD